MTEESGQFFDRMSLSLDFKKCLLTNFLRLQMPCNLKACFHSRNGKLIP